MKYWDSSALAALIVEQGKQTGIRELLRQDPGVVTWTLSEVEVASAISRLEREHLFDPATANLALREFAALWSGVGQVLLVDPVKARAKRLLRVHALKAAAACQLGAALLVANDNPPGWSFVCLDERLRQAASREGFAVEP